MGGVTLLAMREGPQSYTTTINDQTLMLDNFECLVLLSPSEIRQEVCKLMFRIGQGIDWYKVLVVGKNGKLNETIEVSALWSNMPAVGKRKFKFSYL